MSTTLDINTYVKRSFSVDAVQVTAENFDAIAEWVGGVVQYDDVDHTKAFVKVRVHHPLSQKQTQAYVGDWVLSSATGYKVYTNKAFKEQFDLDQTKIQQISAAADDLILKLKG